MMLFLPHNDLRGYYVVPLLPFADADIGVLRPEAAFSGRRGRGRPKGPAVSAARLTLGHDSGRAGARTRRPGRHGRRTGLGARHRPFRDLEPAGKALRPRRGSGPLPAPGRGLGHCGPQPQPPCRTKARPGRRPAPGTPHPPSCGGPSPKGRRCSPEPGHEAAGCG